MTDTTDPTAPSLEFVPYPQQAPNACRTTRHCADHGFCRRCQPEFSAVMSRVNSAIQRTDSDEQHWGPLYAAVAEALRGSHAAAPVVVPAADRAALRDRRRQCPDREPLLDVQCVKEAGHEVHSDRPGRIWYPEPADRAAVERVRALHRPAECVNVRCKLKQWCIGCDPDGIEGCDENPWPCLTIRALDGEQPEPTVADRYGDDHSCADSGCSGEPGPAVEAQPGKDTETPQPKEA